MKRLINRFETSPSSLIRLVTCCICCIPVVEFFRVAWVRLRYPYELDWLESGMVEHVRRLLSGENIYTAPNIDFVTFPYGPVTSVLGAVVSWPFGAHFWELRLISIASTLGTFVVLAHIARLETKKWTPSFVAVGIYAVSYRLCGAWFDVGKPDSLFLFLGLLSVALARGMPSRRRCLLAGIAMGLAVLTKQTAILLLGCVIVGMLLSLPRTQWRRALWFGCSAVVVVVIVSAIFIVISGRWYLFFVWTLLQEHSESTVSKLSFFTVDSRWLWLSLLLVGLAAIVVAVDRVWRKRALFYIPPTAALIAGAWISRLHSGGYDNVLMPAAAAVALLAGIAVGVFEAVDRRLSTTAGVCAICIFQLWGLRYDVVAQQPTVVQRLAISDVVRTISSVNGDVLVFSHPTYGVLAKKQTHASFGGVVDVVRGTDARARLEMTMSIASAIHQGRFAAVVLDDDSDQFVFPPDFKDHYVRSPIPLASGSDALAPITGWIGPPSQLWTRRSI